MATPSPLAQPACRKTRGPGIAAYFATVFLSSFLLFQIQPMVSKALLPAFGGSYLVWGACMVFFQAMLLLGYVLAHVLQKRVGIVRYARFHGLLLLCTLIFMPFGLGRLAQAGGAGGGLAVSVFSVLLVTVGLPFLALSMTSLLLQRWLAATDLPDRENPYVLYGVSNLGSILALLSYPLVFERSWTLEHQDRIWWSCYLVLIVLHLLCVPWRSREPGVAGGEQPAAGSRPRGGRAGLGVRLGWFALSAAACSSLLAVTNVITLDVASVPFLWILPLVVYLLSYVVTFKRKTWYPSWSREALNWAVILGLLLHLMAQLRLSLPGLPMIALHLAILFVVCLNCSGTLMRRRPADPEQLTTFYLLMAVGGLVGGVVVSWIVPVVSTSLIEYPFSLACAVAAVGWALARPAADSLGDGDGRIAVGRRLLLEPMVAALVVALALTLVPWAVRKVFRDAVHGPNLVLVLTGVPVCLALRRMARRPLAFAAVALTAALAMTATQTLVVGATGVERLRNYYGIYRVFDVGDQRFLQHGSTLHGCQYTSGPDRETPLAYFHPSTPAADLLCSGDLAFRDIGMIGLGTGALAAYAGQGQTFTVFELDPDNLGIAEDKFSYLDVARSRGADLGFEFGDGRLLLRARQDASFDLLIVDAFNSGSIPVHLLTSEAFRVYLAKLRPSGLLLFHISNKVLDLEPIVFSNARAIGAFACSKTNAGDVHPDAEATYWAALSLDRGVIEMLVSTHGWRPSPEEKGGLPAPWTDQYSDVLRAMVDFAK